MPLFINISLEPVIHDKARDDWEYFHISPKYNNIEWRAPEEGEHYELVLKRDSSIKHLQGVFYNFPDKDEFGTGGELFTYCRCSFQVSHGRTSVRSLLTASVKKELLAIRKPS